jgi:DsbC/DsbD-like thiol-disulfide interchange protein
MLACAGCKWAENLEVHELKNIFRAVLFAMLAALSWLPQAAQAAMSEWADSEGGRVRLVAISQPRNDAILALLQIEPKPGWKTYWRNPGDAGMPPQLDFTGSTNLVLRSVAFPVPEIGNDDGGRFVGYHHPVSLVVEFAKPLADVPSTINLNAIVGICEKVCLPFMTSFSVPLTPGMPESEEFTQLQLAQSALPEAPSKDFSVRHIDFTDDMQKIDVEIALPSDEKPEIAFDIPPGFAFGHVPGIKTKDRVAHLEIPVTRMEKGYPGGALTLLVKSGGRAMESTLAFH